MAGIMPQVPARGSRWRRQNFKFEFLTLDIFYVGRRIRRADGCLKQLAASSYIAITSYTMAWS